MSQRDKSNYIEENHQWWSKKTTLSIQKQMGNCNKKRWEREKKVRKIHRRQSMIKTPSIPLEKYRWDKSNDLKKDH